MQRSGWALHHMALAKVGRTTPHGSEVSTRRVFGPASPGPARFHRARIAVLALMVPLRLSCWAPAYGLNGPGDRLLQQPGFNNMLNV